MSRVSPSENMTSAEPVYVHDNKSATEETFIYTQMSTDLVLNTTEYNKFG